MTDPFTAAIATALATKAVDGLTEAGKIAFKALMQLVRRKMATDPQASYIVRQAEAYPTSDMRRHALAEALARAMVDDVYFSEQLMSLWRHVQEGRTGISSGPVSNVVSGDIEGSVVQARDIHGNVSFG
jgi:hypothetical protein